MLFQSLKFHYNPYYLSVITASVSKSVQNFGNEKRTPFNELPYKKDVWVFTAIRHVYGLQPEEAVLQENLNVAY